MVKVLTYLTFLLPHWSFSKQGPFYSCFCSHNLIGSRLYNAERYENNNVNVLHIKKYLPTSLIGAKKYIKLMKINEKKTKYAVCVCVCVCLKNSAESRLLGKRQRLYRQTVHRLEFSGAPPSAGTFVLSERKREHLSDPWEQISKQLLTHTVCVSSQPYVQSLRSSYLH